MCSSDLGLSDKNLNIFFAQMNVFANKLEDMFAWANNWAESQQKQREALKAGSQQRLIIVKNDLERIQQDVKTLEGDIERTKSRMEE